MFTQYNRKQRASLAASHPDLMGTVKYECSTDLRGRPSMMGSLNPANSKIGDQKMNTLMSKLHPELVGSMNASAASGVSRLADENGIPDGKKSARQLVVANFRERHQLFMVCFPIALFSTFIALSALIIRRFKLVPEEYLAAIDHPYAAQVLGIVVGYLLIMRLNVAMTRWDQGMSCAQLMEAKWNDAYVQLIAFLESSKKKFGGDQGKLNVLIRAEQDLVHYFSLLHAVACINLYYGEGQSYGIMSAEGAQVYQHFVQVSFEDPSGRVLPLADIKDPRQIFPDGATMSRKWWPYNLAVLGEIVKEEAEALATCQRQTHLVFMWLQRLVSTMCCDGIVTIPPPIYSRVYQEMSNGMLGFMQAYKISVLPFPLPLTNMTEILLVVNVIFIPFLIEKFTKALIFTPVFTFFSVFGMFVMHSVTMQLEMPFGDDFIDLPLREMHNAFNSSLLQNFIVRPDKDPLKHYRSTPFCDPNWLENSIIEWESSTRKAREPKAKVVPEAPEAPVFLPANVRDDRTAAPAVVENDVHVVNIGGTKGRGAAPDRELGPSGRQVPQAARSDGFVKREVYNGPTDRAMSAQARVPSAPRRRGRSRSPARSAERF